MPTGHRHQIECSGLVKCRRLALGREHNLDSIEDANNYDGTIDIMHHRRLDDGGTQKEPLPPPLSSSQRIPPDAMPTMATFGWVDR